MTVRARATGHLPPTASIGELEYQNRLRGLYERLLPDVDPEPYLLGVAILRAAGALRVQMDTQIYQPAGHSIAHMRILMALAAVGPTTPTELARFNQVSQSSISSVLRTLKRNGHVILEEPDDDADGRVKIVKLSPAGEAAMVQLFQNMRPLEEVWAGALTDPQRRRLVDMLGRMMEQLDRQR